MKPSTVYILGGWTCNFCAWLSSRDSDPMLAAALVLFFIGLEKTYEKDTHPHA